MCRVDAVLTLLAAKGYHCATNSFRSRLVGKGQLAAAQHSHYVNSRGSTKLPDQISFWNELYDFFFFLLFQQQQQQIYSPNYVWLWLN